MPFALPTAVAGIALTTLYGPRVASAPAFGARDSRRVHAARHRRGADVHRAAVRGPDGAAGPGDLDPDLEEAAATLGASATRLCAFCARVAPAALTGFALAFARGVGEYGSVIFISGNMPMRTEIAPLLIVTKLEQFDYAGATAIAPLMLLVSFVRCSRSISSRWSGGGERAALDERSARRSV